MSNTGNIVSHATTKSTTHMRANILENISGTLVGVKEAQKSWVEYNYESYLKK